MDVRFVPDLWCNFIHPYNFRPIKSMKSFEVFGLSFLLKIENYYFPVLSIISLVIRLFSRHPFPTEFLRPVFRINKWSARSFAPQSYTLSPSHCGAQHSPTLISSLIHIYYWNKHLNRLFFFLFCFHIVFSEDTKYLVSELSIRHAFPRWKFKSFGAFLSAFPSLHSFTTWSGNSLTQLLIHSFSLAHSLGKTFVSPEKQNLKGYIRKIFDTSPLDFLLR